MGGIYHIFYGQYEFLIARTDHAYGGVVSGFVPSIPTDRTLSAKRNGRAEARP
jgi:hypothetical protein